MKFSKLLLLLSFIFSLICCQEEATKPISDQYLVSPIAVKERPIETLKLGSSAPPFNLPDHQGSMINIDDYQDAKVLAIVFTCNHCPTAQAYEDRLIDIVNDYRDSSFQLIAITPNSPLGLLYNELGYTDLNDDFEAMKPRVEYKGFNFPYLYDGDDHAVSLQYGPVATPHAFVFNQERKLIYVGRIDENEEPGTGQAEDLRNAINAGLADKVPNIQETKTFGCSTKWAWKTEYKEKDSIEWATAKVGLEKLDLSGVRELMQNNSEKLRLINVYATWCGPCLQEYPEFIILQRMYGNRPFEFVSLSLDKPKNEDQVVDFLKKEQSAVQNFLYSGTDKYELIEEIDPDWNGALPYTVLLDQNGNRIWSHQGIVDFLELKRQIVEHELLGRYY